MRTRRPLLALVAAVAVVAGTLAAGPATASSTRPARAAATPAPVHWTGCAARYGARVECGTVRVPLDWSKPAGARISLAVTRLRHTAAPYQGVMLVNPGGPGGSGTGLVTLQHDVPHGGGNGYDWIGFDPRGVGDSRPRLSCIPDYAAGPAPKVEPTNAHVEQQRLTLVKRYATACGTRNGALLQHMTTVDAARDLDAVRAALGREQLNYYGFSYGTYLGQVYSTLFPGRVRRMVFDGTVDPRGVWYAANLDQDAAFERTIGVWFGWLAKYDAVYHLGTTRAAVSARYTRVKRELTRDPVGPVGGAEWNDIILNAGYYQSTWTDLAGVFAAYAVHHDEKALKAAYRDAIDATDDNDYAVYSAVQCTDARWPATYASYRVDTWRIASHAPFETWDNAWFNAPCLFWPVKAHPPLPIDGSRVRSVLMIDETLDAATPYPGSLEVRRRYPGARLIAEPGGTTHAGSLYGNACVDDRIAAYLAHGTLPARRAGSRADVRCAPSPQPVPAKASTGTDATALLRTRALGRPPG